MHSAPTTFVNRAEAEGFLASIQTDLQRGTWLDPSKGKTPFEDLVLAWRGSRPNMRPGTSYSYASYLRSLLLPFFNGMPADQITTDVVREWHQWASSRPAFEGRTNRTPKDPKRTTSKKAAVDTAEEKNQKVLSPNTVAKAYRMLKSIMEVAVDDGVIARNPCRLRGVASDHTPEQRVATAQEVLAISQAIEARYRAMVLVAAYGGLRLGELTGLRRNRLNFKDNTIRVVEQVTQPDGKTFVTGPPKTEAGVRTVSMPPEVMEALRVHVRKYSEPGATGLVFTSPNGGFLRRANFYRRIWDPARKSAGCPDLRFHDLRHTHATLAASMGIDIKTLMARMGHSSPRAALMYQHAVSDETVATGFSQVMAEAEQSLQKARKAAAGNPTEPSEDPSDPDAHGTSVARGHLRVVQ